MNQISSKLTPFYKRIFPALWFGILAVVLVGGAIATVQTGGPVAVLFIPLALIVFGYFLMKHLCWNLLDEVYDADEALVVKNKGQEDTIQFTNITNVSHAPLIAPPSITLTLRTDSKFGREIKFMAPVSLNPFAKNPLVQELVTRIDLARGG